MFDDPKKELEKLEKQLLEEEEWFAKELDSAKRMIGQMPEKKTAAPRKPQGAKPAAAAQDKTPEEPRKKKTKEPEKKGIKGLLILMALELLGILGVGAYWALILLK